MKQEDKKLLYKDLCMRLPYHPQIHICNDSWEGMMIGEFDNNLYSHHLDAFWCDRIEIKPYLHPMSSMTEEEHIKYESLYDCIDEGLIKVFDWLNANQFDYRGLIPKSLALEMKNV